MGTGVDLVGLNTMGQKMAHDGRPNHAAIASHVDFGFAAHLTGSAVGVFKPDDVVFTQVATRLHVNDFQRNATGVGQAVHCTQGNVGGLVFGNDQHFVTVGDFCGAGHHDPVFGTVMVLLQAQAGLGLDLDALDFEAAAFVNAVVPAPGAVHFAMQAVLFALLRGELVDDVFHVLAA